MQLTIMGFESHLAESANVHILYSFCVCAPTIINLIEKALGPNQIASIDNDVCRGISTNSGLVREKKQQLQTDRNGTLLHLTTKKPINSSPTQIASLAKLNLHRLVASFSITFHLSHSFWTYNRAAATQKLIGEQSSTDTRVSSNYRPNEVSCRMTP